MDGNFAAAAGGAQDFISIIDDNASFRRALGILVHALGYPVHLFGSAEAFLESGAARASSCVITDVCMPGMTGPDLQRHLIDSGVCVPLIFICGDPDPEVVREALAAGAVAFHGKPLDRGQLLSSIERALSRDVV